MIKVRHTRHAIFVWDNEKRRGIVYPATIFTDIEIFTSEVRRIALDQMIYVHFVSLVFDPTFGRNYLPMREFINKKEPKCRNLIDGDEKEMYAPLQYDDNWAIELHIFFFEHTTEYVYKDGYVEYNFRK